MLRLICGLSGSGKSAFLLDHIKADIAAGTRCYLLIPEQQAYTSERDFPALLPENAGLFFEVVHFSGLADEVFRRYGGVTQISVDAGIRTLLMWDTLRTVAPMLRQYGKGDAANPSLTARMLRTVDELRVNGIASEDLETAARNLPEDAHFLKNKLLDLSLIDAVYKDKLETGFGEDPSEKLIRAAHRLSGKDFFSGCHVYVDSFTSFTVQEYAVLREVLCQAEDVTVSLCMDSFHTVLPHFESVAQTGRTLTKLARDLGIRVEKEVLEFPVGAKPDALRFLGENLWKFDSNKQEKPKDPDPSHVRLVSCSNLYEEAEFAALQIMELVESGLHYGEIAVIVRDTETYRGVLDTALERHSIPYFLSERTELSSKPLSRLVLSALRCISRNFRRNDLVTLIKTGLCGVSPRDAAMFEEYCETWHLDGSAFCDRVWSMNPDGLTTERSERANEILDAANRVREIVMTPLLSFLSAFRASPRVKDHCRALYQYLTALNLSEVLSRTAEAELSAGRVRDAGETVRLYQLIKTLLTTLCKLIPDTEMTAEEFTSVLSMLFSSGDLGSVPDAPDCVVIGSAATLRVENVKASIVLGLCEGEFPRSAEDDGLLTESDKEALEEFGIILDSREKKRFSEELFYLYRAMTKPTEKLILSTVSREIGGEAKSPSIAMNRVCYLLGREPEAFETLPEDTATVSEPIAEPSSIRPSPLPDAPQKGKARLTLSQSRINAFLLCPYRYYSTYQLKLREKKDATPSYADDGTFLHYLFEKFLRHCLGNEKTLVLPAPEDVEPLADRIINEYISGVCPFPPERIDYRTLHLFTRLRTLALLMLRDILGELRSGKFVPSAFEKVIGGSGDDGIPAPQIPLKDGSTVTLTGKIDRVDVWEQEEKIYVRVVDYKSGTHEFKTEDVATGADIQLILYLFAVSCADPAHIHPAGAEYVYSGETDGRPVMKRSGILLDDENVRNAADNTKEKIYLAGLERQSAEQIRALTEEMNRIAAEVAERILAGDTEKTPSKDACAFCPVRENCDKAYHE